MRHLPLLLFAVPAAIGQPGTASIQGTVLDGKTQKCVPAAVVVAIREGAPPFSRYTKSGGDGAFRIEGLTPGAYAICVQAGDEYLDPCQWSGNPTRVTLTGGAGGSPDRVQLSRASVVTIQVQDPQKLLLQNTKDGRHPDLSIGVGGPRGLYYPARRMANVAGAGLFPGSASYSFRLAVPRDTELDLEIASRDLSLGDSAGAALAGNARRETLRHATGDVNPKSFAFRVLGLL